MHFRQTFRLRSGGGNSDGTNDIFLPVMRGVTEFELLIFNRWGELLFLIAGANCCLKAAIRNVAGMEPIKVSCASKMYMFTRLRLRSQMAIV